MSTNPSPENIPSNNPEVVGLDAPQPVTDESVGVTAPAKVMRIGSMIKQLLDEVHSMNLDAPSRERLAEIYERSIVELTEALSPELADELRLIALPFRDGVVPSEAEIRVAKRNLWVGWRGCFTAFKPRCLHSKSLPANNSSTCANFRDR